MAIGKGRDPLSIDAGELRHSVAIQSPSTTPDTTGKSMTPTAWATIRSTMAQIYTAGSRETSMADQMTSQISHVVKVRWTQDIVKPNYRVVFGSRFFTIQAIENVLERNRVLLLYCVEVDGVQ